MRRMTCALIQCVGCAVALQLAGCLDARVPLELSMLEPSPAQARIAEYHFQEAAKMRQKSEEQLERARLYEGLFGAESDWVAGSRLLARSYEEEARSHEDQGRKHLRLVDGPVQRDAPVRPVDATHRTP